MEREIYVVTHGEKEVGPNPGMTPKGFKEVEVLRALIPFKPSTIVCGTGRRHLGVAKALGLNPDRYASWAGEPDSMEMIDGKKTIILADGTIVEVKKCLPLTDGINRIKALPHNAMVCGGRPLMILLDKPDAQFGRVYKITIRSGNVVSISEM